MQLEKTAKGKAWAALVVGRQAEEEGRREKLGRNHGRGGRRQREWGWKPSCKGRDHKDLDWEEAPVGELVGELAGESKEAYIRRWP